MLKKGGRDVNLSRAAVVLVLLVQAVDAMQPSAVFTTYQIK